MAVFRRSIIILAVVFLACILPSYCETESQVADVSQEFLTLTTRDRRGAEEKKYYKDDYGGDRKVDYERKDTKEIDYKGDEYDEYEFGPFYDFNKLYKSKYSRGRNYYNRYSPHGYPRSYQSYHNSYDDRYNSRPYSRHYPRYQRKSYPRHSDYYSRRY